MCGIAGIVSPENPDHRWLGKTKDALSCLIKRGPDAEGIFENQGISLGHRRLSIIDLSSSGNQPMHDRSERYTIVFNGEFFNYKEHKQKLKSEGVHFSSDSDTEVLLHLFIKEGINCLHKVNGFFAAAVYDKQENKLTLLRDRYGIKPLYYAIADNCFLFASEPGALLKYGIKPEINTDVMHLYFRLNYVPGASSIIKDIQRLKPGHYLEINTNEKVNAQLVKEKIWYRIPYDTGKLIPLNNYGYACRELYNRLNESVKSRLISDVPLGSFLSGGIDSSIIAALAAKHTDHLSTFSIGFADEPLFDETIHAEKLAKHIGSDHHAFRLTTDQLFNVLTEVLQYPGEPFADSSALAVYILSRETRKHVTVALSGDGADELFAGYRKHRAEWLIAQSSMASRFIASALSPFKIIQGSRNSITGNKLRQINRLLRGASLSTQERYFEWCCISTEEETNQLIKKEKVSDRSIDELTAWISEKYDFNSILLNDCNMLLPGDMLTKVDLMSMANSLEVRVPFLDYHVAEWAFSLPVSFKINRNNQKRILKDTFNELVPQGFFERKKQGFEVPLLRWMRRDLKSMGGDMLETDFIEEQGLFNTASVKRLIQQLNSKQPGDAAARIWALLAFQWWYKKYIMN